MGDEFKFPKKFMDDRSMKRDLIEIINNFATLNIIVCWRPGPGKSTFIKHLINVMIYKTTREGKWSRRVKKYMHRKYPLTLNDTPASTEKKKVIIDLIKKKIEELH